MFETWDNLCRLIYRPLRSYYEEEDLGPIYFSVEGVPYERVDFEVINPRGFAIKCSHFRRPRPESGYSNAVEDISSFPVVIYCHGNCGNRLDSFEAVELLLPVGITVIGFDFAGCGVSEGETISLGHFEQHDIRAIVEYVRANKMASCIGLWGRSMGAVSSVMYSSVDPTIAGLVLDSPFSDLQQLIREIIGSYDYNLPWIVFAPLIRTVRASVRRKADFDILSLDICPYASKCFSPALFGHGMEDTFVLPSHSRRLYESYQGDKNYVEFLGGHNSPRPDFFKHSVSIFFTNTLLRSVEWIERPITTAESNPVVPALPSVPPHANTPSQFSSHFRASTGRIPADENFDGLEGDTPPRNVASQSSEGFSFRSVLPQGAASTPHSATKYAVDQEQYTDSSASSSRRVLHQEQATSPSSNSSSRTKQSEHQGTKYALDTNQDS
eukprot:TRINITY_DN7690_c0_g2_i7.p1 TRINITY_DN7690_c0_g2~~TRINITY_DN7690_c0_g2_i7.p1  ORF type:complete len:440 (-),score=62.23 TRINITY_DN7690_c0_g2_i7:173-1492(-)